VPKVEMGQEGRLHAFDCDLLGDRDNHDLNAALLR
jgi:hypothetical protein